MSMVYIKHSFIQHRNTNYARGLLNWTNATTDAQKRRLVSQWSITHALSLRIILPYTVFQSKQCFIPESS